MLHHKHVVLSGGLATSTGSKRWLSSSMQEADESSSASWSECLRRLDQLDVFGPWSLLPTPFGERHSLSFVELFECHSVEARRVEEQVLASFGVNEPKTLLRQFLDRAFCHLTSDSSNKVVSAALPDTTLVQTAPPQRRMVTGGGSLGQLAATESVLSS